MSSSNQPPHQQQQQRPNSNTRPDAGEASTGYSCSSSAPYRLANAAAAAASPLLGYLSSVGSSSTSTPGQQHDQHQQQQHSSASYSGGHGHPKPHQQSTRRPSAIAGLPLSSEEISAAAAIAGSPASNMPPLSSMGHRRVPSSDNPMYQQQQPERARATSSASTTPAPGDMRRTSSVSGEDARKKESRNLDSIVLVSVLLHFTAYAYP